MEALAVVTANGVLPFAQLIATDGIRLSRNDTLLAISSDPSVEWARALHHIQRRGVNSIAVVIDGTTFGRTLGYNELYAELEGAGIPAYRVCRDDPLDAALSQTSRVGTLPMAFSKR